MKLDQVFFSHRDNTWMVHHSGSFTFWPCTADEARQYVDDGYRIGF